MNDRIFMENYLLILKSTVEVYVHGTLESSNNSVRTTLKHALDETMQSQADTYDKMASYGWYQVKNVNTNVITETLNNLSKKNWQVLFFLL